MKIKTFLCATTACVGLTGLFCKDATAQQIGQIDINETIIIENEPTNTGRLSTRLKNAMNRLNNDVSDVEKAYNNFKKKLSNDMGIQYSIDVSVMGQKGVPNGGKTATQTIYAPTVSWELFDTKDFGSGTITASYTAVRYWGNKAANIQNNLFLADDINDYTTESNAFDQLTYTHSILDNKLSLTVGQFPIYDFDGTQYDSNQQTNFVNYALSQNASETYPIAGLGAYLTVSPDSEWSLTAGFQNARNISGETLSGRGWGDHRYTTFGSLTWTPTFNGRSGQYSVIVYYQPWVDVQPQNTTGWSVNASQNLTEKWGVFARANGVTGDQVPVKQSYVLGAVYNNPFNRNALDQIGLAVAVNKISSEYFAQPTRDYESVAEGFWTFGITQFLAITPDVQVYYHPALKEDRKFGTVFSLRATVEL